MMAGQGDINILRNRVKSAKSTEKITGAMRLVAAAKVRRAQAAVLSGRPVVETLASVLYSLREKAGSDLDDIPYFQSRDVKTVGLLVISGERGLCGGYNNKIIKMTENRIKELEEQGVGVKLIVVGKKA